MVAHLVPSGSEDSLCSVGRKDAGGCETPEPEDAESTAASSQNAECEDLELTVCASQLLVLTSRHNGEGAFLPEQAPCQTAQ